MVARAGWQLIQLDTRPQTSFRAPLEYMVGRELLCRVSPEPPNGFGGEHPRGKRFYLSQIPFAETRNDIDNNARREKPYQNKETPLAHGESSGLNHLKQLPIYIRSLLSITVLLHQEVSGFSLQLSFLKKKARSPVNIPQTLSSNQ